MNPPTKGLTAAEFLELRIALLELELTAREKLGADHAVTAAIRQAVGMAYDIKKRASIVASNPRIGSANWDKA